MDPRRPREGKQTVLWTLMITSGSKNVPIPVVMEPNMRADLFCGGHMVHRTGKDPAAWTPRTPKGGVLHKKWNRSNERHGGYTMGRKCRIV